MVVSVRVGMSSLFLFNAESLSDGSWKVIELPVVRLGYPSMASWNPHGELIAGGKLSG